MNILKVFKVLPKQKNEREILKEREKLTKQTNESES